MKKNWMFVVVVILVVSSGLMFSAAEVPKKAVKALEKGNEALQKKEFDKALEAFDNAIELAPEYAAAYYGKGRLYLEQKNTAEAINNLEKAIELDPENADMMKFYANNLFQLGGQAYNQRQLDQSNTYYSKLAAIKGLEGKLPDMYQKVLFQLGTNYFIQQKNGESNQYYLKLLSVPGFEAANPRLFIQTTYQVGANYAALKDHKKAVEYFIKLIELPELEAVENLPLKISTLYMIGLNANFAGDFQQSIDYMVKFLQLAETSPDHAQFMPLANLLIGTSYMSALQDEVGKIAEKDKKVDKAADMAKSKTEIETYLSKALELNPNLEPAYMHLGNYYYYCHNLDKTIETYKTLIEKFPNSPDIDQYKKFLEDVEKEAGKEKKK